MIPVAGLQLKASAATQLSVTQDEAVSWALSNYTTVTGAYGSSDYVGQCISLVKRYICYGLKLSGTFVVPGDSACRMDEVAFIYNNFDIVRSGDPRPGDIFVWDPGVHGAAATYGHVGIITSTSGSNYSFVDWSSKTAHSGSTSGYSYLVRPNFASVTVPTAPSVHLSKSNLAVNETATLTWSNCSGASYYWISCWSSTYQCISEEGFNYSKQVSFSKPGKYSITVCSGNSKGEVIGNWIEINVYDSKPTVPDVRLDRSSIQSGNSVIASWDACSNATNYNIDIWKSNTHIETLYVNADLSHSVKISSAGTYKIYVTAINNLGGSTSEPKEVKVYDAPQKPVIKSITSNPDGTVTLTWTPCNNADKYSIRFFKEGQTTEYVFLNQVTSETQYTYSLPDGNYTSFVTAENSVSHTNGDMSSTFSVKKSSYILSFDPNNGECSTLSKTVIYNSTYGSLPVPTRDGYTFDGWYTSAIGGNQITADSAVTITEDQTLYAHWTYNSFIKKYESRISLKNSYIYGSELIGMTSNTLISQFENTNIITSESTDRIGTGLTVSLFEEDGQAYDSLSVVVFGDVDGDGWYDGMDSVIVNCLANGLLSKEQIGEAGYMAADCNHDNNITQSDTILLELSGIKQYNIRQSDSGETETADILFANEFDFDSAGLSYNCSDGEILDIDYDNNSIVFKSSANDCFMEPWYGMDNFMTLIPGHTYRIKYNVENLGDNYASSNVILFARNNADSKDTDNVIHMQKAVNAKESAVYNDLYTVPENCPYIKIRFGIIGESATVKISDLVIQDVTDADDESVLLSLPIDKSGAERSTIKIKKGTPISNYISEFPEIARNGYYFDGWYTEKNGLGVKISIDTITAFNITLYPYWEKR